MTWLVRWRYSIDEWVGFGLILPMEPARMPQYVSLFIIGMVAYRGNWLHRLPVRLGLVWLGIGVMASAGVVATQALLPGLVDDYLALEGGGRSWPALLRSTLEALIAAGLSLGLLVLFRCAFRRPRPLLATMAKASYPAYILHVYLVVGLQAGILSMPLPGLLKFATVAVFGVALSFGVGHWCGQVPGLRTVLGTKPASPPTPDTITVRRS